MFNRLRRPLAALGTTFDASVLPTAHILGHEVPEPIADQHSHWLFGSAFGLLLFAMIDAAMTVFFLQHGLIEANPVMVSLATADIGTFVFGKLAITAGATLVLVCMERLMLFRLIRTGLFLHLLFASYAVLLAYEYQLFQRLPA